MARGESGHQTRLIYCIINILNILYDIFIKTDIAVNGLYDIRTIL